MFTIERERYPVDLAVSVDEMKRYLLVKNIPTDVQTDLTEIIKESIDQVEVWTRRALMPSDFALTLEDWPESCIISLDRYPVTRVNSIQYRNLDTGSYTPMTLGVDYTVDNTSKPGRILMIETPSLHTDYLDRIKITFSAGHQSKIPLMAKLAVKLLVASTFENRQDSIVKGKTKAERIARSISITKL